MQRRSYGLLHGKKGVIFGALDENSIAWHIARHAFDEGAYFVLSNAPSAIRFGKLDELAHLCNNAPIIKADATNDRDLKKLYKQTEELLGGNIDFIVHSIGMSLNLRKNRPYTDLDYSWMQKSLDISAISLHRAVQYALPILNDGASIVALSYIGAQRVFPGYDEMSDAKALLESIVRNFGARLGRRGIRINTVSQSPTRTTAGAGIRGFDAMYEFADRLAPLGNASASDCADYVVTLLSDLTRKVTLQNLYHDGGFSSMGISMDLIELFNQCLAAPAVNNSPVGQ